MMHSMSPLSGAARRLATALLLVLAARTPAADVFSAGILHVPAVTVGNATLSTVVVTISGIDSGPQGTAPLSTVDSYDPTKNLLSVATVNVGANTYYNVVATVANLVSVGDVAGADSFDGTRLTIPAVLEDGVPVTNVVVTIDRVLSVAGGMPLFAEDQYDSASRQLAVPLVRAGGKVYTNVLALVGAFESAGSAGSPPVAGQLAPATAAAGTPGVVLTMNGAGFVPSSVVMWNDTPLATTFLSATSLQALVPESDLLAPGSAAVTVSNAATGGPASAALAFAVTALAEPNLTVVSPASTAVASPSFALTVLGTGFTPESVVTWNGSPRATTYVTPTQLSAGINAADAATPGTVSVAVVDPASGNVPTNALSFIVTPAVAPTLTRLSPASVAAGSPGFTLVAQGVGFGPTSVVSWNGAPLPTTLVSSSALTASVTAAQVATAGTAQVTVANAGAASTAVPLPIGSPSIDAVSYLMNPAHTGAVSFRNLHVPTVAWSVDVGGTPSYALIAGGAVYVIVRTSLQSELIALSAATGARLWGPVALASPASAAYDAGRLFVSEGGFLQAIDAKTGKAVWTTLPPNGQSGFASYPTAVNGLVFVVGPGPGGYDGALFAIDEASGAVVWSQPVEINDTSAPAVTADGAYVTFTLRTYDFQPALGTPLWLSAGPGSGGGGGTPIVANGVVYSPDDSNSGFGSPYIYEGSMLDAQAGTILGTFGADSPPALTATTGFFMQLQTLHGISLGKNGAAPGTSGILWSFAGDGNLTGSPIVINDYVIIASTGGNLYAVTAATGQQRWTQNIGSVIPGGSSPGAAAISALSAGDGLLVVSATSTVTAFAVSANP